MAANAESSVSVGALRYTSLNFSDVHLAATNSKYRRIYNNEAVESPVLQCLQIKQLQSKNSSDVERFRCVFSDIDNFIQSMLGTCTPFSEYNIAEQGNTANSYYSLESSCSDREAPKGGVLPHRPVPITRR